VRIGFVHYNTAEEIDRLFAVMRNLARPSGGRE
jgi:selenocysteine lyase/cysteine desulfurase